MVFFVSAGLIGWVPYVLQPKLGASGERSGSYISHEDLEKSCEIQLRPPLLPYSVLILSTSWDEKGGERCMMVLEVHRRWLKSYQQVL